MRIKSVLKSEALEIVDKSIIQKKRNTEVKKYKDPRRRAIYSKIELTPEQKRQIDELYISNYGHRIPYTWHRHFTAFTGRFDKFYFPELLFIPEFEHFMNLKREYYVALADKSITAIIADSIGVASPKNIIAATGGILRNYKYQQINKKEAIRILNNVGEAFCKPSIDSSSGRGCRVIDVKNGTDTLTGKSIEDILKTLGSDYLIQERIKCHKSIESLHKNSVNTFRVMTYRWKEEIRSLPVIMRIGQGGAFLDNAHAGGMFIAVEEDGQLHKTAFTEFREAFNIHPNSGVVFGNYKIELTPIVIATAKKMHMAYPDIGLISWDFTIDEKGDPLLIEANLSSQSVWLPEMAHGCGAFGEHTPEILRWMRVMKSTKHSDRHRFMYGMNI